MDMTISSTDPGKQVYYPPAGYWIAHWAWGSLQPVEFFRREMRGCREENTENRHCRITRVTFKKNAREYVWYA